MDTVDERLHALERRCEHARRANRILILAVIATACLAGAQGNTPVVSKAEVPQQPLPSRDGSPAETRRQDGRRKITVHELVLVDDLGRPRARFAADGNDAAIHMFDEAGRKRLELGLAAGASGLRLFDSAESRIVSLQLPRGADAAHLEITSPEGTSRINTGGISVHDAAGRGRVHLALVNGTFPVLGLSSAGQNGPPSVELTATEGSRSLKLHDEAGHPTFSLHAADDGKTSLNMRHSDHERSLQISTGPNEVDGPAIAFFAPANDDGTGGLLPHLRLGLDNDRRPYIRIDDRDGRPVFTAP
jgi:hypothetical protein